jgi:hypothetical protein
LHDPVIDRRSVISAERLSKVRIGGEVELHVELPGAAAALRLWICRALM